MIIGSNGQLGSELARQLRSGKSELGDTPAAYQNAVTLCLDIDQLDITDLTRTMVQVKSFSPAVIFNCAGYTNVGDCETHATEAFRVNAIGSRNLAMAAEQVGAKLIYVSTDYVFSGERTTPYREYDMTNPLGVYGLTKLAGEKFAQQFCSRWFVVRTAWLYGYNGKNFVKTMLKLAKERSEIAVVDDQFGNPTNAADLAFHLLKIALTEDYGIYHCTGNGVCSWYDFVSRIVALSGSCVKVKPCSTEQYASPVKRPAYSALEHMMLNATVGDEMRSWQDALDAYMIRMQEGQ
jgi:dTDP-4-dehydrorhamnose reductase